jgi:hypothetical protein
VNPVVRTVTVSLKEYSESCLLSGDSVPRAPAGNFSSPDPTGDDLPFAAPSAHPPVPPPPAKARTNTNQNGVHTALSGLRND